MPTTEEALEAVKVLFGQQGIELNQHTMEHLLVFLEALKLYYSRSGAYGQIWQQYGALSNLINAARKVDRTMEVWWTKETETYRASDGKVKPLLHKDNLDDAFDCLNYLVFFIRNARSGNLVGSVPERPDA